MSTAPTSEPGRTQHEPAAASAPTVAHRVQYAAILVVVALLRTLGFARASAVGGWLGRLARWPFGVRRRVVERHLRAVFPEWSEAQILRTSREAYDSIGRTFVQAAVLPGASPETVRSLVTEVEGWDILEAAVAHGKGVILVTGHLGNWELGGAYLSARGVPTGAIYRGMENPLFDAYVARGRAQLGAELIRDLVAARRVPRALGAGYVIAFLSDQDALGLASTFAPFFGRPARTPRGAGVFALRLRTPVVFASCTRLPNGTYRFAIEEVPVHDTGDREADIDRVVLSCNQALERHIRRAPGQYFWHHRRWKRQPPETPVHLREP